MQGAVGSERLRPDPRRPGEHVVDVELRQELPRRVDEAAGREIADGLGGAHPPVPAREAAEAGRAQRLAEIAERHVAPAVALAREREHGVRPEPHRAVRAHRRVDAEERERRVRHRVDQPAHELALLRPEDEVVPAERARCAARRRPRSRRRGGRRTPRRRRPRATPRRPRPWSRSTSRRPDARTSAPPGRGGARRPRPSRPARTPGRPGRSRRRRSPASALRGRRRRGARSRADAPAPISSTLRNAVRDRATMELLEARQLVLVRRHHDLAAAEDRDPPLLAVHEEPRGALDAELRLERPRDVVDASMDDAARVPGLVRPERRLLVEHRESEARAASPGARARRPGR